MTSNRLASYSRITIATLIVLTLTAPSQLVNAQLFPAFGSYYSGGNSLSSFGGGNALTSGSLAGGGTLAGVYLTCGSINCGRG